MKAKEEMHKGGRPTGKPLLISSEVSTLPEMGIDHHLSARAQRLAGVNLPAGQMTPDGNLGPPEAPHA